MLYSEEYIVQAGNMHDVTHWTKEQVADWVFSIATTGKHCYISDTGNSRKCFYP